MVRIASLSSLWASSVQSSFQVWPPHPEKQRERAFLLQREETSSSSGPSRVCLLAGECDRGKRHQLPTSSLFCLAYTCTEGSGSLAVSAACPEYRQSASCPWVPMNMVRGEWWCRFCRERTWCECMIICIFLVQKTELEQVTVIVTVFEVLESRRIFGGNNKNVLKDVSRWQQESHVLLWK